MRLIQKREEMMAVATALRNEGKTIGFVPTMGALHQGHLSLVQAASENDVVVCSIFVNPVQFNDAADLQKYPRTLKADLALLEKESCDIVFAPSAEEMYPEPPSETYDFGLLEQVMEGAYRSGHFNGVAVVVKRLFDIVQPHKAYFGFKDFQQLTIIEALVKQYALPVEIVPCPIIREDDGLAMSSRNRRLPEQHRALAPEIHRILKQSKDVLKSKALAETKQWVIDQLNAIDAFRLEYFTIVDRNSLQEVEEEDEILNSVGCVALYLGDVRLIDNIEY